MESPLSDPVPSEATVSLHNVSVQLNGIAVLQDVSFEIRRGEMVALVGSNGAGKSSVANVICGYYRPYIGEVVVSGVNTTQAGPARCAQLGVRRSFQSVSHLSGLQVVELVMLGAEVAWGSSLLGSYVSSPRQRRAERAARSRAMDLLEMAGLDAYAERVLDSCPYGIRKLADVVRTFMSDTCNVLILDEPTSGISEPERESLRGLIEAFRTQQAVQSLLIIDHDVAFVRQMCPRAVVLESGGVLASGACDEVLADSRVLASFIGSRGGE